MIFLTSSIASVADDIYQRFLSDKGYKSVLFVDTAAEPVLTGDAEDDEWFYDDIASLERQGYTVNRYTVTGKTQSEVAKAIDEHDILYVSGGNTCYLLRALQQADVLQIIKDKVQAGKTYIGASAGSIVVGNDIAITKKIDAESFAPGMQGTQGIGLVDFVIFPHWGSQYFADGYFGQVLEASYKNPQQKHIALHDSQYVEVLDLHTLRIWDTE